MSPLSEETTAAIHERIDKLAPQEAAVIRATFGIEGDRSAANGMSLAERRAIRINVFRELLTRP